jgi:predicted DNA-binding WGR domain protein
MEPYIYTVVELIYVAGNSNKRYRGWLDHQTNEVQFQFGKYTPAEGSWTDPITFDTLSQANDAMMRQIQAKLRKGYWVNRTIRVTCAQACGGWARHTALVRHRDDNAPLVIANV